VAARPQVPAPAGFPPVERSERSPHADGGPGDAVLGRWALLVPVKAFASAKVRLARALSADERYALARRLATGVIAAGGDMTVAVVCDDLDVAGWARDRGALVIWEPGRGLNGAVQEGLARLGAAGVERVVVAHADLPLVTDLRWVAAFPGVTLVPDRRGDGTNVIGVPARCPFAFSYGPGSFSRHRSEAASLGVPVRTVYNSPLAWDVDEPADLLSLSQ
jgi:2-phospho-L-lactate guanylyltransferase